VRPQKRGRSRSGVLPNPQIAACSYPLNPQLKTEIVLCQRAEQVGEGAGNGRGGARGEPPRERLFTSPSRRVISFTSQTLSRCYCAPPKLLTLTRARLFTSCQVGGTRRRFASVLKIIIVIVYRYT
jgi:hypothetical protein